MQIIHFGHIGNRLAGLVFFLLFAVVLNAQNFQPVDKSSQVRAIIRNVGMDVECKFSGLTGDIKFNASDLKTSSFSVSVNAGSIMTGIDVRDENLKTQEYLDANNFPKISFVSKEITAADRSNTYLVKGTLSIKGIGKEVVIPFTTVSKEDGILFTGELRLNRNNFKIGIGNIDISENLVVLLSVFGKRI